METVSFSQFIAHFYQERKTKNYKRWVIPNVLRYWNYELGGADEHKWEMVVLHVPFRNEKIEVRDRKRYRTLYNEHEAFIMETRKESNLDITKVMEEHR